MNREYRKKTREEGFTLVEVMIVVAIIAILAATSIPLYLNYKKKAEEKAADATLNQFTTLIPEYQAQHGKMCPDCRSATDNLPKKYTYDTEEKIRNAFPKFQYNKSKLYDYKVVFTVTCKYGQCTEEAKYTATPKNSNDGLATFEHTLK